MVAPKNRDKRKPIKRVHLRALFISPFSALHGILPHPFSPSRATPLISLKNQKPHPTIEVEKVKDGRQSMNGYQMDFQIPFLALFTFCLHFFNFHCVLLIGATEVQGH